MPDDTVADDEYVLRRVPATFCDESLTVPVQRLAFRPAAGDTDGLSVYRERVIAPQQLLAVIPDEKKRAKYFVVRLAVRDIRGMGLTIVPTPDPGHHRPGHASIREMNITDYHQNDGGNYKLCGDWQQELAKLASRDIIHRPPQKA